MRMLVAAMTVCCLFAGAAGARELLPPGVPRDAGQVIVVRQGKGKVFQVEVSAMELRDGRWNDVLFGRSGVIGPKGFAPRGEKREGDGRTPTGVYRIGTAFGADAKIETGLAYRRVTADDFWVDDAASPQYNRWVTGKPAAKSFERLLIEPYKYAAVIEYNTDPVVPGNGSAIFLHVWSGPDRPTAGCVALAEVDVKKLLKWLDRGMKPVIVLNP